LAFHTIPAGGEPCVPNRSFREDNRKNVARHITAKELTPEEQFDLLRIANKHLVDTIKMIAYRAEIALASAIKDYLSDKDDARMMIKRVCTSEADIIPDMERKVLRVQLHYQACESQDVAIRKLCEELNETETLFPGTNMRLVYELITHSVDIRNSICTFQYHLNIPEIRWSENTCKHP